LPIFTPEKVKNNKELEEDLKKLDADFFVVLAY
jgi:methionyl-tRNA formyltransferase